MADHSLTPDQYVARGAPAADHVWTGADYASATQALKKLSANDPLVLPRLNSPVSGAYFARMISAENVAPLTNTHLSANARLALGLDLFDGPKQLTLVYLDAGKPGAVFDNELAELLGYQIKMIGPVLDLLEQFLKDLDPADPRLRVRIDGLMQMRQGLGSVVDGALIMLTERDLYGVEPRRRLGQVLGAQLPRLAIELPNPTRNELPARLNRMAEQEPDPALKSTLNKLAQQSRSIGPSRLDAAVATLESKAKALPHPRVVWSWHTSSAGGFRAEFPGTPDEQTRTGKSKNGTALNAVILSLKADDGSSYTLLRIDSDAQLPDLNAIDQMLVATFPGGKVLDKSEFDAPVGRRGRQMLLRVDRSILAIRAAYVKGMIYEAIAETPGQSADKLNESSKRFLESFQITQK